jgi:hypothetical protein
MWIVIYSHKHGTDVWGARSRDEADRSCCEVALDWVRGLDDAEAEALVLGHAAAGRFGEAVEAYTRATGESPHPESFEIEQYVPGSRQIRGAEELVTWARSLLTAVQRRN